MLSDYRPGESEKTNVNLICTRRCVPCYKLTVALVSRQLAMPRGGSHRTEWKYFAEGR